MLFFSQGPLLKFELTSLLLLNLHGLVKNNQLIIFFCTELMYFNLQKARNRKEEQIGLPHKTICPLFYHNIVFQQSSLEPHSMVTHKLFITIQLICMYLKDRNQQVWFHCQSLIACSLVLNLYALFLAKQSTLHQKLFIGKTCMPKVHLLFNSAQYSRRVHHQKHTPLSNTRFLVFQWFHIVK